MADEVSAMVMPPKSSLSRVVLASAIGSALEWYDFFIYGTAAALVFNELFFPKLDPRIGTLAAFATFGVGFFARPFGGLVFGHFGDRMGRKPVLVTGGNPAIDTTDWRRSRAISVPRSHNWPRGRDRRPRGRHSAPLADRGKADGFA